MPLTDADVHPFEARASDADLRARLAAARLPEAETVQGAPPGPDRWAQGVPLSDLVEVVDHWRTAYDCRVFEERLHAIGQPGPFVRDVQEGLAAVLAARG